MVVVLYGIGRRLAQRWAMLVAAVTLVAAVLAEIGNPEVLVLAVTSAVLLGGSHSARAEIAQDMAVQEVRTRIARELHDVVAHHMSVLAVQAETAPHRFANLPPDVAAEFMRLAQRARDALNEMRSLLGALRGSDSAERRPQPTLCEVENLVRSIRGIGTPVELEFDNRLRSLDPLSGLSLFRIVQESVSNALKHAPGQPLDIRLTCDATTIRVQVRNRLIVAAGPAGHGLAGMHERVKLLNGALVTGPNEAGEFVIEATIPAAGRL